MTDKIINISDIKFFLYLITKQNNFKLFNYYIYKKRKKFFNFIKYSLINFSTHYPCILK